jgi:hypothetical protein
LTTHKGTCRWLPIPLKERAWKSAEIGSQIPYSYTRKGGKHQFFAYGTKGLSFIFKVEVFIVGHILGTIINNS